MNYETLVDQIRKYCNRITNDDFFNTSIPYFINNSEARINREVIDIGFQIMINGNMHANAPLIPKPANWNKTISLQFGAVGAITKNYFSLYSRTYEFCRSYWPDSSITNTPLFYSDGVNNDAPYAVNNTTTGPYNTFFIAPTPNLNYAYQLVYLSRPVPLSDGMPTNFLTDRFPDLLFYGCMVEAMSFIKDDERVPVWESLYSRALKSANAQTEDRYTDRTSIRDKD